MVNTADARHADRNINGKGNFGFPFEPYSIQTDFMTSLYYALDNNKIGIFESPTGTVCENYFILVDPKIYCFSSLESI